MLIGRFCTKVLVDDDSKRCFESVTAPMLYKLLEWAKGQRVGKNCRRKRGIGSSGSLCTLWKIYLIVYRVAMGKKLDENIRYKMHEVAPPKSKAESPF